MALTSLRPSALGEMAAGARVASVSGGPPGWMTCQATASPTATTTAATTMVTRIERRKQHSLQGCDRASEAPDADCFRAPADDSTRNAGIPQTGRSKGFHFNAACATIVVYAQLRRSPRLPIQFCRL